MSHVPARFAIVVSRFNADICEALLQGCVARLQQKGVGAQQLAIYHVPGAVEIPLLAQQIARHQQASAIICLGAVIQGQTNHYDYVCEQVSMGCQRVSLDYNLPVIFGVLTTQNKAQAWDRVGGTHGHKGSDAADAALDMVQLMSQFATEGVGHE